MESRRGWWRRFGSASLPNGPQDYRKSEGTSRIQRRGQLGRTTELGALCDFRKPGARGPSFWISAHGSYHNFNWHEFVYVIEGLGVTPAVGVNLRLPRLGHFRVGISESFFSATSSYDAAANGQSMHVTLDFLFEFGRTR